jgi:hypothetical protein
MKRTFLSLIALCFLPWLCRADVFIERFTQVATRTGLGEQQTIRFKGWIISDIDGTNGAAIATTTVNGHKLFFVDRSTTRIFNTTIDAGNGREYSVVAQGETETKGEEVLKIDALLYKGLNTSVEVSASRQIIVPRVMRGTSSRVEFVGGSYRLDESSSSRIFSQTETRAANGLGRDVEAVIAEVIQKLEKAGYVNAS